MSLQNKFAPPFLVGDGPNSNGCVEGRRSERRALLGIPNDTHDVVLMKLVPAREVKRARAEHSFWVVRGPGHGQRPVFGPVPQMDRVIVAAGENAWKNVVNRKTPDVVGVCLKTMRSLAGGDVEDRDVEVVATANDGVESGQPFGRAAAVRPVAAGADDEGFDEGRGLEVPDGRVAVVLGAKNEAGVCGVKVDALDAG